MFVRLFKTNQLSGIFALLLLQLILFTLPALQSQIPTDNSVQQPLFSYLTHSWITHKWLNLTVAFLLIFTQSLLFNIALTQVNALVSPTYLPAFCFILLSCMAPYQLFINPAMIAGIFVLPALLFLLDGAGQRKDFLRVFNAGLFLSIGSLFYLPLLFFLPFLWIAISIVKKVGIRELLITTIGFALPYFYAFSYYFYIGQLSFWHTTYIVPLIGLPTQWIAVLWSEWVVWVIFLIWGGASLLKYHNQKFAYKVIQRKMYTVVGLFALWLTISLLLVQPLHKAGLYLYAFPLGMFFSFYLFHIRKTWWGDIMAGSFLVALLFLQLEYFGA